MSVIKMYTFLLPVTLAGYFNRWYVQSQSREISMAFGGQNYDKIKVVKQKRFWQHQAGINQNLQIAIDA